MYTVKLKELKYRAGHGLYGQEVLAGNDYSVSIEVSQAVVLSTQNDLSALVDYGVLKDIIDHQMAIDTPLLEDLIAKIVKDVQEAFPHVSGQISIQKHQPPFGGRCYCSEVAYTF